MENALSLTDIFLSFIVGLLSIFVFNKIQKKEFKSYCYGWFLDGIGLFFVFALQHIIVDNSNNIVDGNRTYFNYIINDTVIYIIADAFFLLSTYFVLATSLSPLLGSLGIKNNKIEFILLSVISSFLIIWVLITNSNISTGGHHVLTQHIIRFLVNILLIWSFRYLYKKDSNAKLLFYSSIIYVLVYTYLYIPDFINYNISIEATDSFQIVAKLAISIGLYYLYVKSEQIDESALNGYIYINIPDEGKDAYLLFIKGFENYTKLKGYELSFSYDSAFNGRMGFKFTTKNKANVTEDDIKKDFEEYVYRVKNNKGFDDMPHIISEPTHRMEILILKNRIVELEMMLKLQQNVQKYFEGSIEQLSTRLENFHVFPTINGSNNTVTIIDGKNIITGSGNIHDTDNSINKIRITDSFKERKEQINNLDKLIEIIKTEKGINDSDKVIFVQNFNEIKNELSGTEPSKSKIFSWLSATKSIAEKLIFTHHTYDALKWLYESFNFVVTFLH